MAVTIHTPARRLRLALVVTCACVAMRAALAPAAERFVDGACPTSGTGLELSCGDAGPFRTITEGILAMQPGDTLSIRGAHAAFDGVYFEALMLRDLAPLPGQSLPCTNELPCVIQGCRAGTCPDDEQPTVRGMIRHDDWIDAGGGVWTRAMEENPNPDGLERDLFDPHMVLEGTGETLVPMAYAGDGITAPGDGEWSYHPATQRIAVNPTDLADPATTVYVPH